MLFYIGFSIRFDRPSGDSGPTSAGYVALVAIYIFAAVYQFGWRPVVWKYCSVGLQNVAHESSQLNILLGDTRRSSPTCSNGDGYG